MTTTSIQIRWSDIDQLRHVYNGQYQHFFDIGKSDYFTSELHLSHNWAESGEGLLTVRTLNNYFAPIEMEEPIVVETHALRVGTKSFELYQRIINSESGEVKSDSHSTLVCYNPIEGTTYAVPSAMRSLLELDANNCGR